jgi:hypothetical protein
MKAHEKKNTTKPAKKKRKDAERSANPKAKDERLPEREQSDADLDKVSGGGPPSFPR